MDPEIAKAQEERKKMEQELASLSSLTYDTELYGNNKREDYLTSIPVDDNEDLADGMDNNEVARKLASYTAPKSLLKDMPGTGGDVDDGLGSHPGLLIVRMITVEGGLIELFLLQGMMLLQWVIRHQMLVQGLMLR